MTDGFLIDDPDEINVPVEETANYLVVPGDCRTPLKPGELEAMEDRYRKSRHLLPTLFETEDEDGNMVWDDDRQATRWQSIMITPGTPKGWPHPPTAQDAQDWLVWRLALEERRRWKRLSGHAT